MADTENQPTATTNDADNGEVKEAVAADEKTATATNGSGDATETTSPAKEEPKDSANGWEKAEDIYGFSAVDIDGKELEFSKYRGSPMIIVNVATNCGFTRKNYRELNELYSKYSEKGLKIVAFPCNQFMNQEPGCEADIKEFAAKNDVKFDMMSKIDVNGATAHPLYKWLKLKQKGVLGTQSIKWNFTKFLIDPEGKPTHRFSPTTSPLSIEADIKKWLDA